MKHTCHAKGCDRPVPPRLLMCRMHWFLTPKPLRDAVWAAYMPGQEITKDASDQYLKAAHAAIEAVADIEKQASTGETLKRLPVIYDPVISDALEDVGL